MCRISLLAYAECPTPRLHVHHASPHLLLRVSPEEIGKDCYLETPSTLIDVQNVTAKSGYLAKRGKQNPKFNRYWFTLKGDVLSYFTNPSDLYFPSGNIDLTYGISASLDDSKDKGKETTNFSVVTIERVHHFKADSPPSAKEWVKTLQKVIFRSHNDGDSVKISLPVENIIDVEESPVIDFAKTLKIRVVDSDETYAIDEVSLLGEINAVR